MRGRKRSYYVETLGSPVLKKISEPVETVDEKIRELAALMIESMVKFNGVGLAAPQIGRNLRMVALGIPADSISEEPSAGELALLPAMPLVVLNPEIVELSEEKVCREEGCLSVPGVWAEVERPRKVIFRAVLLDGSSIEYECDGLLARCLQHELDHLDGLTFVDRLSRENLAKVEVKVKNLRREGGRSNYRRVL